MHHSGGDRKWRGDGNSSCTGQLSSVCMAPSKFYHKKLYSVKKVIDKNLKQEKLTTQIKNVRI